MGGSTSKDDCIDAGFYQENLKYGNVDTGMKIFDFHGKGLFTFTFGMVIGALITCTVILIRNRLCPYSRHANGSPRSKSRFRRESDDYMFFDYDARRSQIPGTAWPYMNYIDERELRVPPTYTSQAIWAPSRFTDVTGSNVSHNRIPTQAPTNSNPPDPSSPPPALNGNQAT